MIGWFALNRSDPLSIVPNPRLIVLGIAYWFGLLRLHYRLLIFSHIVGYYHIALSPLGILPLSARNHTPLFYPFLLIAIKGL